MKSLFFKKWAKYLNQHFTREDILVARTRYSASLVIREMQIKYHYTHTQRVEIKKNMVVTPNDDKSVEKWNHSYIAGGNIKQ